MSYIALYRKYRSQTFGELMGQDHVTRTLQNAIRSGHIAQAYLFHGARGCGKTSTARLISRALNCIATDKPNPEPCGVCRLCISIREGTCLDVVEIDAASETGVDNVREKVIENVQYAPAEARYKVYIIDEVHDLSSKAFDALLKTIEEPPPHVVFVLATTEYHKVPITIRSRCQQYQFKRGTLQDLGAAIQRVVEGEGYTAEPEAVLAVARAAEGSWRDALSLLEQVIAYAEGGITSETVQRAIGTVGGETLALVTETLAHNDWSETLAAAADLTDSGTDVRQLLTAMSGHLRDLLLLSAGAKNSVSSEMGEEKASRLLPQAVLYSPDLLLKMLEVLSAAEKEIRFTNQHRWLLERTLLKLMPANIERNTAAFVPERAPVSKPPPRAVEPPKAAEGVPQTIPRPEVKPELPSPRSFAAADSEDDDSAEIEEVSEPRGETFAAPSFGLKPDPVKPTEEPAFDASRFADAITPEVVKRAWPRILKLFERASPSGAPWLAKAQVLDLQNKTVVLGFPASDSFAMNRIQNNAKGKSLVEEKINEGLNTTGFTIRCQTIDERGGDNGGKNYAPPPPAPSADDGMSMTALLDVPIEQKQVVSTGGFGDFALPTVEPPPPSPRTSPSEANIEKPASAPMNSTPAPRPPDKRVSTGLLKDALELMGGTVIKSEPI